MIMRMRLDVKKKRTTDDFAHFNLFLCFVVYDFNFNFFFLGGGGGMSFLIQLA